MSGNYNAAVWILLLLTALPPRSLAADWPWWRGPSHNGTSSETTPLLAGTRSLPAPAWRKNVGDGCASAIVAGGRVYTLGWRGGRDTVYCLDPATGRTLWTQTYSCPKYGRYSTGDKALYSGPTATPTFDTATGLLYTLSTDGHLMCWDTAAGGAKRWSLGLYERYKVGRRPNVGGGQRDYGYTMAPLVDHDELLVPVGGRAGLLVALDKRTNAQRWASECKDYTSNAGGLVPLRVDGLPCVAILSLTRLVIARTDPGNQGRTLATYPWQTDYANNIVTPAVAGNRVLLSSGYNHRRMVCLKVTQAGITKLWDTKHYTKVCTPVVYQAKVYTAFQKLRCLDLATGALVWQGGYFGSDGSCLVTADGRLLAFGNGTLVVANTAEHSPKRYQELARRSKLCRKNEAWPHVVLADGRIYCKDRRGQVNCFALGGD